LNMKGQVISALVLIALLSAPAYALEKTIILVSDNPADLAIAQSLGEKLNIDIVITPWGTLSEEAIEKIQASGATQVYVIGGEVAVPDVEVKLNVKVKRFAGKDRHHTSALVAQEWGTAEEVVIAEGYDEEGIKEAMARAKAKGVPMLFVKPGEVPEEVAQAIEKLKCKAAVVVPAPNMVKERVRAKIREHGVEEINETAVNFEERAATAIEAAEEAIAQAEANISEINGGRSVAAARLVINAKKHLDRAKEAFNESSYGEAFGLAVAAKAQAEAAIKISQGIVVGNFKHAVVNAEQEIKAKGIAKVKGEIDVEAGKHGVKIGMHRKMVVMPGMNNQTGKYPPAPPKRK